MTQSVEDGSTVKIYYESRILKLEVPEGLNLEGDYEEITEYQEQSERERLKSKWSRLEALAGAEQRLQTLAEDIVSNYEAR